VSERTVGRRLADAGFAAQLAEARRVLVSRTVGRLTASAVIAADVLVRVASDPTVPAASRVSAARAILDLGARWRDSEDLEARIAALEAA
jgi:hypothetical protein